MGQLLAGPGDSVSAGAAPVGHVPGRRAEIERVSHLCAGCVFADVEGHVEVRRDGAIIHTHPHARRGMDFQEAIMFLQKVPSGGWTTKDLELVLSQAYAWRASFVDSRAHLS